MLKSRENVWVPSAQRIGEANVTRLMRKLSVANVDALEAIANAR